MPYVSPFSSFSAFSFYKMPTKDKKPKRCKYCRSRHAPFYRTNICDTCYSLWAKSKKWDPYHGIRMPTYSQRVRMLKKEGYKYSNKNIKMMHAASATIMEVEDETSGDV